ncbi:unnamed protein product [Hyaloperonospora brassicae]|uniref:RxLR effector candidate protein n=1 Tax=Hyaloperonospora brassicae TaxID=162125 RepID=A0AAV0UY56_HYABA|nr:unnamed protein product [Hyaloperonospora brassicae]
MGVLLWLLLVFVAFVATLASSAKLRKNAFVWFSYVTITGWYYCRVLHKEYCGDSNKDETSAPSSSKSSSTSHSPSSKRAPRSMQEPEDVVYFEKREVVERRQLEQLERSGSSSSVGSDSMCGTRPLKHKRGRLFRSRRKAAAEEALRRVGDTNAADALMNSGASDSSASLTQSGTRRTFTGRKKPMSWAD